MASLIFNPCDLAIFISKVHVKGYSEYNCLCY